MPEADSPSNSTTPLRASGGSAFDIILERCHDLMSERVSDALVKMFDEADQALTAFGSLTRDPEASKLYEQSRDKIRSQSDAIVSQFQKRFLQGFQERVNRVKKIGDQFSEPELSSLETAPEVGPGESTRYDAMAARLGQYCDEELLALDQRIGVLVGDADLQSEDNPFTPQGLIDAYKQTCGQIDSDLDVRMVLLNLFDDYVLDQIRGIYKAVNALLIKNSILPKIRISVVRRSDEPTAPSEKSAPAPEVEPPITLNIRADGNKTERRSTNRMDAMTLDVMVMLFDEMFDDPEIPSVVKGLIGRLQPPMLKLVITDKSFFSRKSHPARQMLDKLRALAAHLPADTDASDPVYGNLETIIQSFIEGYEGDIRIFDGLSTQLDTLAVDVSVHADKQAHGTAPLEMESTVPEEMESTAPEEMQSSVPEETESTSAQEAAAEVAAQEEVPSAAAQEEEIPIAAPKNEQEERLVLAKAVAQAEIKQRLHVGAVPKLIVEFMTQHWFRVLVLVHVRAGEQSEAWKNVLKAADLLVWNGDRTAPLEERRKMLTVLPKLLKILTDGLAYAGIEEEATRVQLFAYLRQSFTEHLDEPEQPDIQTSSEAPAVEPVPEDTAPGMTAETPGAAEETGASDFMPDFEPPRRADEPDEVATSDFMPDFEPAQSEDASQEAARDAAEDAHSIEMSDGPDTSEPGKAASFDFQLADAEANADAGPVEMQPEQSATPAAAPPESAGISMSLEDEVAQAAESATRTYVEPSADLRAEMDKVMDATRTMFSDVDRFIMLGQYDQAISVLDVRVQRHPDDRSSWVTLMAIYRDTDKKDDFYRTYAGFLEHFGEDTMPE
jgi:Protein of unknown function (DUF1631)